MDAFATLVAAVTAARRERTPVLVGIAGGVGVGKTTLAERLRQLLVNESLSVEVVSTDAFLLPNEELERNQLGMRKGFPESFDREAVESFLRDTRAGTPAVRVPVYSHTIYDRVPGPGRILEPADAVIVEGVNALQPPIVDHLDVAVYIEATEDDMRAWFVDRFVELSEEARDDEQSFYRGFAGMSTAQQREIAEWTWREINGVNLHDHIAPSRSRATLVLSKRRDHSIDVSEA